MDDAIGQLVAQNRHRCRLSDHRERPRGMDCAIAHIQPLPRNPVLPTIGRLRRNSGSTQGPTRGCSACPQRATPGWTGALWIHRRDGVAGWRRLHQHSDSRARGNLTSDFRRDGSRAPSIPGTIIRLRLTLRVDQHYLRCHRGSAGGRRRQAVVAALTDAGPRHCAPRHP